jgi:anti-sigma regulatory factor (Ser/Thr protein kinase)/ActR/RegA family two-component response regulator
MLASAQAALALRKTMLVVDPQQDIKNLLDGLVRVEGWNLKQAPDNQTAVSLVKESSFDLIITGQKTTGREDLELLQKVRRVRPHMRMIILTDRGTPEEVIAALCQNAFSYFRAPFDEGLMAHMVRTAMTQPCWDDGIEVVSATRKWIRLLARCTQGTADRLIQFLREADIPFEEREDIALAAHEILLNAMEHGGHFDPNEYVEIGYLRTKRMVVCRVKDPGRGFSIENLHHAAIHNPPDDLFAHMAVREEKGLRPGGFGILLASKLVDEMMYGQHGDDVLLIKYLDPLSGVKSSNWASSLPS